ncbi:MAG TPA: DsbA family protein [Gemmatimonadaceae bacterium]|nr:DsbA family protein [Gemmatimonadaceae bacterium]
MRRARGTERAPRVQAAWSAGAGADLLHEAAGTEAGDVAPARIVIATDPICSRCWAMEPALRRLRYHHGSRVAITRAYGGLLPRWAHFHDREVGIRAPGDVVSHWSAVARHHGQPIDPSVWRTDPLASSYPPTIALHVVRHLVPALEEAYLRRLRHALFLEARNVSREEVLIACAADVGVDWETFAAAYQAGAGAVAFSRELTTLRRLGVHSFPTLLVAGPAQTEPLLLRGAQTYERLVATLGRALGHTLPPDRWVTPMEALAAYGTGTLREFGELLGLDDAATAGALRAAGARVDELASGQLWRG